MQFFCKMGATCELKFGGEAVSTQAEVAIVKLKPAQQVPIAAQTIPSTTDLPFDRNLKGVLGIFRLIRRSV